MRILFVNLIQNELLITCIFRSDNFARRTLRPVSLVTGKFSSDQ